MNGVAEIALLIDAVILICVAPVEMFFLDRPWAKSFLGVEFTNGPRSSPAGPVIPVEVTATSSPSRGHSSSRSRMTQPSSLPVVQMLP